MLSGIKRWTASAGILMIAVTAVIAGSAAGQTLAPLPTPATAARITLGQHAGNAHASKHGQGHTAGGQIEISQPANDTIVVRMTGSVASSQSAFKAAQAAMEFVQTLNFTVDFGDKTSSGKLILECSANGLLRGQGLHSAVTMHGATATLMSGPDYLVAVSLPSRMVGGGDSTAIRESSGPRCVPILSGCYTVQQQFRIAASQDTGLACHKASAQFSSMPSDWIGSADPFATVDASDLGYQLTLRAVSD